MVLATTLVAAGGLAGLTLRSMPARGRLVTMLLIGVTLLAAGLGRAGSPLADAVQQFLDAGGAPLLRNVHGSSRSSDPDRPGCGAPVGPDSAAGQRLPAGVDPFVRPPGGRPPSGGGHRRAHGTGGGHITGLDGPTDAAGSFRAIPDYWHQAADWLGEHNGGPSGPRGPGAGGSRRALRHPDLGQQPRRTTAGCWADLPGGSGIPFP